MSLVLGVNMSSSWVLVFSSKSNNRNLKKVLAVGEDTFSTIFLVVVVVVDLNLVTEATWLANSCLI